MPKQLPFMASFPNVSAYFIHTLEGKFGRRFNLADRSEPAKYIVAGEPGKCGDVVAGAVQLAAEVDDGQLKLFLDTAAL